ncbi:hypothetical protein U9M48_026936 [Paspalum notatum var. saurae]|uniref:F-box domain-containing protein n=1 Tax=Paspalum notatum var. saurae TaxID=547442 RepID=A0AAQ3WZF5_PASNO
MEGTAGPSKRQLVVSSAASPAPAAARLPEDVVRHILLRLPSRSVLRFRAVCKDWLRLISESKFAGEHHALQPQLPLVSFLRGGGGGQKGPSFHIHGSCDGLLLLSFAGRFYVCNPATHQWTRLPTPLRSSRLAGFYRHGPTGEHRALFYRGTWPGTNYYILVADGRRGKGIGLPSEKHGHNKFDTVTEVFEAIDPPVLREHVSCLETDGELAVFCCGERVATVELWLLQD